MKTIDSSCRQWIADVYHCSDQCGRKMSVSDMCELLTHAALDKNPGEYSPSPFLCAECSAYWNTLCDMYPN